MSNPLSDLQAYVNSLIEIHKVPAASIAVWKDGQLQQAAAGIVNLDTQVEATTDTIFQIGSITKVMTTCLVMQLVDEGKIDLDRPVQHYIRDFQIADPEATQVITVRQLLNHTSGMAGDFFPDDNGHEGNLIARYVDRCNLLPLVHPVGEMYSYSNSAFVIAGRLVEVVRGISWYQAIKEYLYEPLGMTHAIADPKELLRFRAAIGHIYDSENPDQWVLSNQPFLSLGAAPVGSTPTMRAADLITFARALMDGGVSQSGKQWLSAEAVKAMQTPSIEVPRSSALFRAYTGLGLGQTHYLNEDIRVFGHAGATRGFMAQLKFVPEQNAAFAVLLNATQPTALDAITTDMLQALAGIKASEAPPVVLSVDVEHLARVTGKYESFDTVADVAMRDGKLTAHIEYKHDAILPLDLVLQPTELGCHAALTEDGKPSKPLVFLKEDARGVPTYLFFGGRLGQRIG
jgi:CubicO group peptidase (beta-lactamase class C family)